MAMQSRLREFSTRRICASWLFVLAMASLAGTAVPASRAGASEDQVSKLQPYTAQYKTTTRGIDLEVTRQLKVGASGSYTLTNGGKIMVVGIHEVSVFRVEGSRVKPITYIYQGTGLINRRREVHFTPGSNTIRSLYKDQWYDLPKTDKTLDRMSQQEQLRLLLLIDPTPGQDISLEVADGKRVKEHKMVFLGEETVETPLGSVRALHFEVLHENPERESDIWLAPDWDYLIVKTVHIEDGNHAELILTGASIDGVAVTAQ